MSHTLRRFLFLKYLFNMIVKLREFLKIKHNFKYHQLITFVLGCLQARANSPEQFVGILLREKTPSSLMNEILAIYSGEVNSSRICGRLKLLVFLCIKIWNKK